MGGHGGRGRVLTVAEWGAQGGRIWGKGSVPTAAGMGKRRSWGHCEGRTMLSA